MPKPQKYRIDVDGEWTLRDFYGFPNNYTQAYSFLYSLMIPNIQGKGELRTAYDSSPWIGGFSTVHFYNRLYKIIPNNELPIIMSIRYSSPGWIDLSLVLVVAYSLRKIIHQFVESARELNELHKEIRKGMHERKLYEIEAESAELKLEQEHLHFLEEKIKVFSNALGLESIEQLNTLSPNRIRALKILLSFYQRVKKLHKYEVQKRLKF